MENYEITYHDHDENETRDERQELCETHELPVCSLRRFKMIKYSFRQDKEYVAIKEDKYDDLAKPSNDECRAYQEIFCMVIHTRASRLKRIIQEVMTKLVLNECMEKAQTESNLSITITNNDMNIELSKEFLMELQNNAYHGMLNEDVVKHVAKDPGENSSQSPQHIDHHCCYGCGDSLDGFDPTCYSGDRNSFTCYSKSNLVDDSPNVFNPLPQPPTYSYEFYGNDAYYGHDCPLQHGRQFLKLELSFEDKPCQLEDILELFRRLHNNVQNIYEELAVYINTPSWDRPTVCYDDDEDYAIAVTPSLSTEEPDNSLSMGDEHLDTISATESNEFIKSSVESLALIPSESEGIPDNMCDVPFHDNSLPLDISKHQFEDCFDSNSESTSTDDDSFSIDNIEYVEAAPPNSELVSSEVMEIVISKVGGIDDDIILTIKDDILREKLLNINLLIANIEALKDNPAPSFNFMTKSSSTSLNSLLEETNTFDNSLPEFETFCFDLEEISSGSTTTHSDSSLYDSFIFDLLINPFPPVDRSDFYEFADELAHIISPPEYDCFCFKNEPNSGDFAMDVVEDTFPTREPRVHDHNVLPTHPTF
nr:hypothetical protein [Tanacetum cinerariifolium]